ncbi:MAG: DUF4192 family protein [Frankiales bacterium]|nr:DUF4192 family protein [Frankiales bacterium]
MTAAKKPALQVRGADSLPALVPHLVGFHPDRSLVAVGLGTEEGTVAVTMRLDLPPSPAASAEAAGGGRRAGSDDVTPPSVEVQWEPCIAALRRVEAGAVLLVVYPDPADDPWRDPVPRDLPHRDLVAGVTELLVDAGFAVPEAICVVGDRLRSYSCADPACCPVGGRLVDTRESLRVRTALIALGSAPLPSRSALAAILTPREPGDPMRRLVRRAARVEPPHPGAVKQEVREWVAGLAVWGGRPSEDPELARLAGDAIRLCAQIPLRDALLHVVTGDARRALLPPARRVLTEAVRSAPRAARCGVAAALAVCAWVDGDGASARVALEAAIAVDPYHSLATLVMAALDRGLPPDAWVALMADLDLDDILRGPEHRAGDDRAS